MRIIHCLRGDGQPGERACARPRGGEHLVLCTLISVVSMPTKAFQSMTRIYKSPSSTETFRFPSRACRRAGKPEAELGGFTPEPRGSLMRKLWSNQLIRVCRQTGGATSCRAGDRGRSSASVIDTDFTTPPKFFFTLAPHGHYGTWGVPGIHRRPNRRKTHTRSLRRPPICHRECRVT